MVRHLLVGVLAAGLASSVQGFAAGSVGLASPAQGFAASTASAGTCASRIRFSNSLHRSPPRTTPRMAIAGESARERRQVVLGFAAGLTTALGSWPTYAAPVSRGTGTVRAPLPPGDPDPKDWETLTSTASTVEAWGDDLEDPASWKAIAEQVEKAPFTQDAMDLMFRKAAKNLPSNALLGSDAGYWAGVRVEAMQAMDAFAVEVQYLQDARKKKDASVDSTDLKTYHGELVAKMNEFIAIKNDVKICKRCAGKTVGVAAGEGKVREFTEEERVRFGKD